MKYSRIEFIEKDKLNDVEKVSISGYRDRKFIIFSKKKYPVNQIDKQGNITTKMTKFRQELQFKLEDFDRVSVKEHKAFEKRRDSSIVKTSGDFLLDDRRLKSSQINYSSALQKHNERMTKRLIDLKIEEQDTIKSGPLSKREKQVIISEVLNEIKKFGSPYILESKFRKDLQSIEEREKQVAHRREKSKATRRNAPWSDDSLKKLIELKSKLGKKR